VSDPRVNVLVVGAGPCGLAAAIACERAGLTCVVLERSCLVSGIASYPTDMTFFSTAERIAIGGIPFTVSTPKPTRKDALAYYRTVASHFGIQVRQYETVTRIERTVEDDAWRVHSHRRDGETRVTDASAVVIATGYFGNPNRLGVPGESLPHVSYRFTEGHGAWDEDVVVVGGANSAVDAALELHRAGARVTLVHFEGELQPNVKPWVRPEIEARIREGSIAARFNARVSAIGADWVELTEPGGVHRVRATQVYTMLGYQPETSLLREVGVAFDPASGIPAHDPETLETPVAGVFVAGVIVSGFDANKTFIENGRFHGDAIARAVAGRLRGTHTS
jgi:thioredoxin reductase (NADPH)